MSDDPYCGCFHRMSKHDGNGMCSQCDCPGFDGEGQPVATVEYSDNLQGEEVIAFRDHRFQIGGQGDGYCYGHQSFECLDQLSTIERRVIAEAR